MTTIRMAQYGTKHGHAGGKLLSMQQNPAVDFVGLYEPDAERRAELTGTPGPYENVHWFDSAEEILDDPSIVAVASEGSNAESLAQTEALVRAGKHVWYDKPAGENWSQWQNTVQSAREQGLLIQMGYMFRYHKGFQMLAEWVHSGMLGQIFSVRAHMSTNITEAQRRLIQPHHGGIYFDLSGHMLDQVVWLLGRPQKATLFLRNDDDLLSDFADNTLAVYEFENAMATVDIAAMETRPMARRFEVYGRTGSAILVEPFEPGSAIRLCLDEARNGFAAGEQIVPFDPQPRQEQYDRELAAFLAALRDEQPPDRTLDHELLVQETLLRTLGYIA